MKRYTVLVAVSILSLALNFAACGGGGGGGGGGGSTTSILSGTVVDSLSQPVMGATVTAASDSVSSVTATDGSFSMVIETGTHSLTIVKEGYTIYFTAALLVNSDTLDLGNISPTNPYFVTPVTWLIDADGDGYSPGDTLVQSAKPIDYYLLADLLGTGDCDDNSSSGGDINPGADELCDEMDNDCDGLVDDDDTNVSGTTRWYQDGDGDGYSTADYVDRCSQPLNYYQISDLLGTGDCDDNPITGGLTNPAANEICDSIDNDCDGLTDDEDPGVSSVPTWYLDADGDGYATADHVSQCLQPLDYYQMTDLTGTGDCDDSPSTGSSINPGALEICDSLDNDCDSLVDDEDGSISDATTWYQDADGDGYGTGNFLTRCIQPLDYYLLSSLSGTGDCDDDPLLGAAIYPGATEVCDGADNDCSGSADDGIPGSGLDCSTGLPGVCAEGTTQCVGGEMGCLQTSEATTETCDGLDNDCDGSVDDIGCSRILLVDDDNGINNRASNLEDYPDVDQIYSADLASLGESYSFDLHRVMLDGSDGPGLDILRLYPVVIWFTGETYGPTDNARWTITAQDENNIAAYLQSGGRLFLAGQDILYDLNAQIDGTVSNSFANSYLGVLQFTETGSDYAQSTVGVSSDPVSDSLVLSGPDMELDYLIDNVAGPGTPIASESGTAVRNTTSGTPGLLVFTPSSSAFTPTVFMGTYSVTSLGDGDLSFGSHNFWTTPDGVVIIKSERWLEWLPTPEPNHYLKLYIVSNGAYTYQEKFGINFDSFIDVLNADGFPSHAHTLLVNAGGDAAGARVQDGPWKVLFLALPYEGLSPEADRRTLLKRSVDWLRE